MHVTAELQMQEASTPWSWSSARSIQHTLQSPDSLQASFIPMCMTTERHGPHPSLAVILPATLLSVPPLLYLQERLCLDELTQVPGPHDVAACCAGLPQHSQLRKSVSTPLWRGMA